MLKNLLKVAVRNIVKEKSYSSINILGLTIGITCSIFLLLYIVDELSYDKYHENAENVYRVVSHIKEPDNEFTWAVAQIPMAPALKEKFPEVKDAVRFFGTGRTLFKYEDKRFYEEDFYLADSTVFNMFSYDFIEGDPGTALDRPNTVVISLAIARKYFDTENAIGKTLAYENGDLLEVTGVIKNVPKNSHFSFDGLISRSSNPDRQGSWGNFGVFTYIQLPENYNPEDMQTNFKSILEENVAPIFASIGITINYELQKITDIHLHSKIQDEAEGGGDISYIYIFSAIAVFMIIIACINYMNLATARSVRRAKEVGIRKVMGSQRKQLIYQFLSESLILGVVAMLLSLFLVFLLLPFFNDVTGKYISFSYILQPNILLALGAVILIVGILAGSYPAFYLSGFKPVSVLKGKISSQGGNVGLRKTLVVLQFCISIFMLISTLVVYDQLNYMRNKDLGFNKDRLIRIEMPGRDLQATYPALRNLLNSNPMVLSTANSSTSPGNNIGKVIFNVETNDGEMVERGVDFYAADYDYIPTLGMELVDGRNFSREILTDTAQSVLVNESMVKRMSWDQPIGKKFNLSNIGRPEVVKVIGVLKDYHQNSLYSEIEPLIVIFSKLNYFTYIKIAGENLKEAIKSVEQDWKKINPEKPFQYSFLDESFDEQYKADEKRGQIFTIFSILTIVIACLGLLGLASFTTQQRTKEIGIRKVMGSSIQSIVVLVSKEFMMLTGLATLLAFAGAYFFLNNWLKTFVYRIELSDEIGTFLLSAVIAMGITLLTVSFHSLKAASINPVNSLRSE
ncbi:ABC transporter permease [Fulvivirgaceae bacterium BMA12]|uniref:ABC transporter permease n=1 Tax=Agaribacillus aureus TaxID=3051825 RepID=A0ABT8LCX9_9BACT|nr:ABC transporter permease [Fulvivirgaceae bacterium BMA12]